MSNVVRLFPGSSAESCSCFVCCLRELEARMHAAAEGALLVDVETVETLAAELHDLTHRADAYVRQMEPPGSKP